MNDSLAKDPLCQSDTKRVTHKREAKNQKLRNHDIEWLKVKQKLSCPLQADTRDQAEIEELQKHVLSLENEKKVKRSPEKFSSNLHHLIDHQIDFGDDPSVGDISTLIDLKCQANSSLVVLASQK